MENILRVVEERDKAVAGVEEGEWTGPRVVDGVDKLGRPVRRLTEEHLEPQQTSQAEEEIWADWTLRYLRTEREKQIRSRREKSRAERFQKESERRTRINRISDGDVFEKAAE